MLIWTSLDVNFFNSSFSLSTSEPAFPIITPGLAVLIVIVINLRVRSIIILEILAFWSLTFKYFLGGYGKTILINHGYGYKTRYAHCSKFNCKRGQTVKRGDHIGYVGNTGQSTGPHLHYEVFKNKRQINPVNFFFNDLSPEEYDKVIEISSRPTQSL